MLTLQNRQNYCRVDRRNRLNLSTPVKKKKKRERNVICLKYSMFCEACYSASLT